MKKQEDKNEAGVSAVDGATNLSKTLSTFGASTDDINKKPILEIKLQNLDSVPEVYYKGKEVFLDRLVSILYNFETENSDSIGKQTIEINGYDIDGFRSNEHISLDTIKHSRLGGE